MATDTVNTAAAAATLASRFPPEKTFPLCVPITFAEVEYNQVTLCEPTADQIELIEARGSDGATFGISLIGSIPIGAAKRIKARDFNALREYLLFFLNASPVTGG